MAFADHYDTQSAIELLKQILDYKATYNREELEQLITLDNFLFLAAFNPKMGSGKISNRTQRFFTTIAISVPTSETVLGIFKLILSDHFKGFGKDVVNIIDPLVNAANKVFQSVIKSPKFSPTARKFHYIYNLRDMSRIAEGLVMLKKDKFVGNPIGIAQCFFHEAQRVFEDRLYPEDLENYTEIIKRVNEFDSMPKEELFGVEDADGNPAMNIFTSFIYQINSGEYS